MPHRFRLLPLALLLLAAASAIAQTSPQPQPARLLTAGPRKPAKATFPHQPVSPTTELQTSFRLQFRQADPTHGGSAFLLVQAVSADTSAQLTLRIPLASTEEAYGESRTCTVDRTGAPTLTFTAGLDEQNFAAFERSAHPQTMHFLLNRYLCRALAAPFECDGHPLTLPANWTRWQLAGSSTIELEAGHKAGHKAGHEAGQNAGHEAGNQATLELSPLALAVTATPFDPATCPVIAPSDGTCCVAGKTTRWHCGGRPAGPGWHQVSGDCFHFTTTAECHD